MASTTQDAPNPKSAATRKRTRRTAAKLMRLPPHDEIALRARALYEQSGYTNGRDVEFWLEAERQLTDELTA
jgi:hypothetical protein